MTRYIATGNGLEVPLEATTLDGAIAEVESGGRKFCAHQTFGIYLFDEETGSRARKSLSWSTSWSRSGLRSGATRRRPRRISARRRLRSPSRSTPPALHPLSAVPARGIFMPPL